MVKSAGEKLLQLRIDKRREIMRAGVTGWHEVVTEEYLDLMAERFIGLRIREMTHVNFEQYLTEPECYEAYAEALKEGYGLQLFGPEGMEVRKVKIVPFRKMN
jgi:hypothetical protein